MQRISAGWFPSDRQLMLARQGVGDIQQAKGAFATEKVKRGFSVAGTLSGQSDLTYMQTEPIAFARTGSPQVFIPWTAASRRSRDCFRAPDSVRCNGDFARK